MMRGVSVGTFSYVYERSLHPSGGHLLDHVGSGVCGGSLASSFDVTKAVPTAAPRAPSWPAWKISIFTPDESLPLEKSFTKPLSVIVFDWPSAPGLVRQSRL